MPHHRVISLMLGLRILALRERERADFFFVMLKQCFDWLSGEADSGERWQWIGCRICSRGSSQAKCCWTTLLMNGLSRTSAVSAAELDWLFARDEVFGDVICCWICWLMHFDQAPVKITVYGCFDLCYNRLNFCWRQLIFRWLWAVFTSTTKF